MRWIKNINPKNILEPSCGDGIFLKSIDAHIKNCHVEAIELLKREAAKARKIKGAEAATAVISILSQK